MPEPQEVTIMLTDNACRAVLSYACAKYNVTKVQLDGAQKVTFNMWAVKIKQPILDEINRRKRVGEDASSYIYRTMLMLRANYRVR